MNETFELKIDNGDVHVAIFDDYSNNYKNYIAEISERHPKYKFSRAFLNLNKFDDENYAKVSDFNETCLYEFRCTKERYNKSNRVDLNQICKIVKITDEKIVFEELTDREAVNFLENRPSPIENIQKDDKRDYLKSLIDKVDDKYLDELEIVLKKALK
jgi:hypothetical protein